MSFRPRLGMGWFGKLDELEIELNWFSSPLGDGLVRVTKQAKLRLTIAFSSPSGDGLVPKD